MSDLLQHQQKFFSMVAEFLPWLLANGYSATFGETLRSQKQAAANEAAGIGISNSLHCIKLAIDLNLFKDGEFLTTSEAYTEAGEQWESLGGSWGGRFKNADGNHFSLSFKGVR